MKRLMLLLLLSACDARTVVYECPTSRARGVKADDPTASDPMFDEYNDCFIRCGPPPAFTGFWTREQVDAFDKCHGECWNNLLLTNRRRVHGPDYRFPTGEED